MSQTQEPTDQEIREQAYRLWEEAGSPEGQQEEFWHRARDKLSGNKTEREIDEANEQSFPASDPPSNM